MEIRFKLEREDVPQKNCSNVTRYVTTTQIRVNNKIFDLPTTFYVIIDKLQDQRFIVFDQSRGKQKVLNDLSQGLQLELESIGNDYKLALVTTSDKPYYYYYDGKDTIIATTDRIPKNYTNGIYVNRYSPNRCSAYYELLEKNKVLVDPKDIIISKNVNRILQNFEHSPDKRLKIQIGDTFLKKSQYVYRHYNVPLVI